MKDRATAVSKRAGHATTLTVVRLLIVDDHPSFRRAARELLRTRGFCVVGEAACARSALEVARLLAPDAVLLDVRLGGDDGYELCRALTHERPGLAVLMTSTDPDRHAPERAQAAGARGFVHKVDLAIADLRAFFTRMG